MGNRIPRPGLEGLDRVVRELERHPHISRPPVPKVWQLTPGSALVATMELPIRRGVDDTEVLALTRYAYERCVAVVGRGGGPGGVKVQFGTYIHYTFEYLWAGNRFPWVGWISLQLDARMAEKVRLITGRMIVFRCSLELL
ncbi:hypothetical protein AG1IA_10007 [Rhizoctonia solani AG-1 IA]|uniref:Uncharacterized protein n=1 Tax=Thanatephorus cucumeris (strain AG1-IA) TaxID=983506 RepID=L8WGQ1_THACA|nr:hypothetical protein AG1IA_10007 [Rhizoctonia solani AG-1 IA]